MSEIQNNLWPGWETVRLIGRGSFGAVYEIQRDVFGDLEKAALKVISIPQNASDIEEMYSDGYDDESITSTFQSHLKSIVAEYSLMRKMTGSSNIVNCDDVRYVQHDDGIGWDIFIKMELLTPLTKALPNDVPEETVVQIAKDMCAALELCKRHEIVHRDIKPQNIFVSANGDYKLGDFGIAKTVEKTMGGTKIGTYKYMAPEVYNNQPYGSAADIYSLGLVLYWMLNERRMPFLPLPPAKLKAGMDEDARHRRLSGEAFPAPAHGSDELKRIVLKACAYDPKDRYSSAAAMLNDLSSLGSGAESSDFAAPKNNSTPTEQDNDMTIGPVFGDAQKQNSGTIETAISDATVGPAFPPKTTRSQTPAVNQPKANNSSAPKDTVEQHAKHNHQWYEFQYEEHQNQENKNKIIKIALGVLGAIALIAIVFALRSCGAGDNTSRKELNSDNKMTQSQQSGECVHQWENANCTMPKTCSSCGAIEGSALGHSWTEATYTAPKMCSTCGITEGTVKARVVDIAAGDGHTLVLKSDGTVQALGHNEYGECNVSGWSNIVDICAGSNHSVGIKSNGTVIAVGLNNYGQCNVADWKDIVYIAAGEFHTVGVRSDGTVVAAGSNHYGGCDVSGWRNVVAVGVTQTGTVGLTADGKILNTKYEYLNWSGIKAISVGDSLAIGLKNNGSVVIGKPWGRNSKLHSDTYSKFKNIISVEAGGDCVFGLTSDGHVITSPGTNFGGVSSWTDICMISASDSHIVGLKKDGTLVATGANTWGQCAVQQLN